MKATRSGDALKIRISQLSYGLHEYHFGANPAEIGLDANFKSVVQVDAELDKTPRQLYLKVDVTTSGVFQCDRCVEEFDQSLRGHYNVFYVYDELETAKVPADEVQVIPVDMPTIDLSEDVRQMVLLSVPLKLLCQENCKGLCPRCGVNRNRQTCDCQAEADGSLWRGLEGLISQ